MTKDEILAALPKLSKADLQAIATVAGALSGRPTNDPTGALPDEATLTGQAAFNALQAALGGYGTVAVPTNQRQKFERKLRDLIPYLNDNFPGWDKTKIKQVAVFQFMFGLLAEKLRRMKLTPTINMMIVNMGQIPVAFDAQFPGYREAGMGPVLLNIMDGLNFNGTKTRKGLPPRAPLHTR